MRLDNSRIKISEAGIAFYKREMIPIVVLEISSFGCRFVSDSYSFRLGSILDIQTGGLFFTGIIANKEGSFYGISIICIPQSCNQMISKMIKDNHIENTPKFHSITKDLQNILILGAGSGKIFSQLAMLEKMEEITQRSIADIFDFIGGVSSGAILSILIGLNYSLADIRKILLKSFNTWNGINLDPIHSILNKDYLYKEIESLAKNKKLSEVKVNTLVLSRNYSNGTYISYSNLSEGNFFISEIVKEAISIPVLFGLYNGMSDAAVGMYINPTECVLRFLRGKGEILKDKKVLYLDAGFDPVQRYKDKSPHLLNQLQWTLEITLKDMILSSFERVNFHFEEIDYHPFIFTFSQSYDLLKKEDAFLAEEEVRSRTDVLKKFIMECKLQ